MSGARAGRAVAVLVALATAAPAPAQTDFTRLTAQERRILHSEVRAALLGLPDLPQTVRSAPPPAADPYAAAVASDLARIAAHAPALFAPDLPGFGPATARHTVALFTAPDCPDCARAEAELRALAKHHDLRVSLLDLQQKAPLARALDLDLAPSYVFPDKMLRGHMPAIVLERYFSD